MHRTGRVAAPCDAARSIGTLLVAAARRVAGASLAAASLAIVASTIAAAVPDAALADEGLPPSVLPFQSPDASPFGCYQDVQIFRSLKDGEFDFCRLRLRYAPGRAECLRIIISTCNLVTPGRRALGPPGGLEGFAERIICPPGPPPPTCPSGYFG
ncbi:hypothetical protein K2Z84_14500 [Candidatus Binatia bacterium]|jgi:hypothetical protein|nr:hypothetical protein [Candidatus Binatia bacterium]